MSMFDAIFDPAELFCIQGVAETVIVSMCVGTAVSSFFFVPDSHFNSQFMTVANTAVIILTKVSPQSSRKYIINPPTNVNKALKHKDY